MKMLLLRVLALHSAIHALTGDCWDLGGWGESARGFLEAMYVEIRL